MPLLSTIGAAAARAFGFLRSLISGYNVANSLRYNSASSDNLSRTPGSAGNRRTYTISYWLKRSKITYNYDMNIGTSYSAGAGNSFQILFDNTDKLNVQAGDGSWQLISTQLFRDVSAWYHIVVAIDTTQATSSNRIKMYVNGSQVTSFSTATYMSQNLDTAWNNTIAQYVGDFNNAYSMNGYMAEVYNIDGQQLTPSSFGETDTLTGIWKPKAYTGSFGTNGFYLKFGNSAALGTDSSGNGNTFTVNNLTSIDQTTDTPTNNFCIMNPLINTNGIVYTEGNLKVDFNGNQSWTRGAASSIVLNTGKWYWEIKQTSCDIYNITGIIREDDLTFFSGQSGTNLYDRNANALQSGGGVYNANSSDTSPGYTYTVGDIVMFALDMTNKKMYIGKNGTWFNSGNPGAGTGEVWGSSEFTSGYGFAPIALGYDLGVDPIMEFNFGSPSFTISSGNADANGYGNFEYAVPSGFYALNTKNLADYG
jgi:hypothetical protein